MSAITTHILDTAAGRPADGVVVVLERLGDNAAWTELGRGSTNADGRLVRIGSRGIESSFLGPDYPDDYYFRFPGGMTRDGGSFLSGRRSVRWRGTAGYEGDKLRSGIPGDVKSLFAKLLQKDYREWTFEEVELSSQSDSGGTRSKKAPFDWEAEIEPFVNRQRSLSLSASVDLS